MFSVLRSEKYYEINIHSELPNSPIKSIRIFTDRVNLSKNYVVLNIHDFLKSPTSLPILKIYIKEKLQNIGQLQTCLKHISNKTVSSDSLLHGSYKEIPISILISYEFARKIIDDLFQHQEMSTTERAEIEKFLQKLQLSVNFANNRTETITLAQKDIIEEFLRPYIETIKSKAPNWIEAPQWIICISTALHASGEEQITKENLPNILWTAGYKTISEKSNDFYESLFIIAKIYSSMGNLESALQQSGAKLPSDSIIKRTILDLFKPEQLQEQSQHTCQPKY